MSDTPRTDAIVRRLYGSDGELFLDFARQLERDNKRKQTMNTLKLDPQNPLATKVQTRDGREARILAINSSVKYKGTPYPIVAEYCGDRRWFVDVYSNEGLMYHDLHCDSDLINTPEPPKFVPFTSPAEIDPDALFRNTADVDGIWFRPCSTYHSGITFRQQGKVKFETLFEYFQMSIDKGKTWGPAGKLEVKP